MKLTRSLYDCGPPAPCPVRFNIAGYILARAAKNPSKPALEILRGADQGRWSYGELAAAIGGVATGLRGFWTSPPLAPHDSASNDPAYIVFTSGTSGMPTGVVHAHRAVWARRMMWQGWYGLRADDRVMHAGAFNWTFTLGTGLLDPWAIGATAIIAGGDLDARDIPENINRSEATIFAAAPGIYRQILKCPGLPKVPTLRHCLSAGEKMPPPTHGAWKNATNTPIYEALGMSEVSTYLSTNPTTGPHPDLAGYPQAGRRLAVLDPASGAIAPLNAPGTLAVSRRDPGLMLGYLDQPDLFAARFKGEWFLTGDTVSMGDDGALTYLGRDDDMLNAGGFRVSPIEVEAAITSFPGIHEAAAIDAPVRADAHVIAVAFTADSQINLDALASHCKERLARYKQPRLLRQVSALPRSANGKVLRKTLRNSILVEDDQA